MQRKKILFISSNMDIGGFQKALISLLRCFDYGTYDVDLFLLSPRGVFMDLIPKEVNLLPSLMPAAYFARAPHAIVSLIRQGNVNLALTRFCSAVISIIDKGWGAKILSLGIPSLPKHYDAAIDFNGQHILYYLVNRVNADRKISFFHSDYKKWPYYKSVDYLEYKKVDAIVTISDLCVASMKEVFPQYQHKISCIENIVSEKTVNLFPTGSNNFNDGFSGIRVVTVGRVCRDKGVYLALEACTLLKKRGIPLRWYWVGPLDTQDEYQLLPKKLGLECNFYFLGSTNNPYNYIRGAYLIAHPSYFEGKSVAIEEAKVLGKPIVATNFSTVENQITHGQTGLIVPMDAEQLADGIQRLIEDTDLYATISQNLETFKSGNESEINKLYKLIEGA